MGVRIEQSEENKKYFQAYKDLGGNVCGGCGGGKRSKNSLCGTCYYSLPKDLQKKLYTREGYAATYWEAVDLIKERLKK